MLSAVALGRIVADAGLHPFPPSPHIMAMPQLLPTYTVDQVRAFPDDGNRYELVEGVLLVTPQPATDHQIVAFRLASAINEYLAPAALAYGVSPGEIEIAPKLHLEPDLLVFPSRFRPGTKWTAISDWWLAVEVFSPSSRYYDRDYKMDAYLRLGVREVWLVDLDRRCVEVAAPGGGRPALHHDALRWQPVEMRGTLELPLSDVFRDLP